MSITFRGYDRRTVATADVQVGDRMSVPGAGMFPPVAQIVREREDTVFRFIGEAHGRRRWFAVRRKTAGKSTIHVPAQPPASAKADEGAEHSPPPGE